MAASLLVLAVALLVSAGFGDSDKDTTAPMEVVGGEVRVPDLKICMRGSAFLLCGFGCDCDLDQCGRLQVTYGSVIKLMHEKMKHQLHS